MANFLRDGLGSTAALTDATGTVEQSYSYEPYGNTTTSGNTTTNSYEYLGRETDATGLYYFRNRYYSPITQTFIGSDPIGLVGGPNLYQYAAGNPTTFSDPSGKVVGEGCAFGVGFYLLGQGLSGRKPDKGSDLIKGLGQACLLGEITEGLGPLLDMYGAAGGAFANALAGEGTAAFEAEEEATYVFHGSPVSQDVIFNEGLQPNGDSTDLLAHALDPANPPSNFVSTSTSFDEALEHGPNVYVIQTPANGIDVNATLGTMSPYPWEQEIAVPGGIGPSEIRAVTILDQGVSILNPGFVP